jgi:hypothetical protein
MMYQSSLSSCVESLVPRGSTLSCYDLWLLSWLGFPRESEPLVNEFCAAETYSFEISVIFF